VRDEAAAAAMGRESEPVDEPGYSGQLGPPPAPGWPGPERPGPPRLRRDVSLVAGARAAARSTDEPKKVPEVSGLQRNGYRPN